MSWTETIKREPYRHTSVELETGIKEWFEKYENRRSCAATSAIHALARRGIYTVEELIFVINQDQNWYKHVNGIGPDLAMSLKNYICWIQGSPTDIDLEIAELREQINELNHKLREKLNEKMEVQNG